MENITKYLKQREYCPTKAKRCLIAEQHSFHAVEPLNLCNTFGILDPVDEEDDLFQDQSDKITEIISTKSIVISLSLSGRCCVFSKITGKIICLMNTHEGEVVKTMYYNEVGNAIITVSVYPNDNFESLICRSSLIENLEKGLSKETQFLFETISLKYPSFVEFDHLNNKILLFSDPGKIFKVYQLDNYKHLYDFYEPKVQEIKFGIGILLFIQTRTINHLPLLLVDIESGKVIDKVTQPILPNQNIEVIELFKSKLLIKVSRSNFQLIDLITHSILDIQGTKYSPLSVALYLRSQDLFVMTDGDCIQLWNSDGKVVLEYLIANIIPELFLADEQLIMYFGAMDKQAASDKDFGIIIHDIKTNRRWKGMSCDNGYIASSFFYCVHHRECFIGDTNGKIRMWK